MFLMTTGSPSTPTAASGAGGWPLATLIALCAAGLALRLCVAGWGGYMPDLQTWQIWSLDRGEQLDLSECPPDTLARVNHPPLFPAWLRVVHRLHHGLGLPGDDTRPILVDYSAHPQRWSVLIRELKSPAIIADLVTAALLFAIGCCCTRTWLGVALAGGYLFNPAILYDGAYWGQTDTVLVMFLVAGVWAYVRRRPVWLGAMLMAAPLMKAQAVFALPVFGLAIVRARAVWRPHFTRIAFGGLAALIAVAALAWWTGRLRQFHDGCFGILSDYPFVTLYADNLWWLLGRPWNKAPALYDFPADTDRLLGLVSYRITGIVLFFTVISLVLWRLHRARYTAYALALALVASGWAFFNLLTQMHERYSVPAAGLMMLLPLWDRKWWVPAIIASITITLNMAQVCPLAGSPWPGLQFIVNAFAYREMHVAWMAFAVVHVLMLPLVIDSLWRAGRPTPSVPTE